MLTTETYGAKIREARKRRGLTFDRLAGALGTTRQVVIRWERDENRPNSISRRKLAEFFDDLSFEESDSE